MIDKDGQRQTMIDKDRPIYTKIENETQRWKIIDKDGQTQTNIDKGRQTQTKIG